MPHRRRRFKSGPREFPEVELQLEGLSHLGGAVARREDLVYFTAYGLPGERVTARVVREHGSYARAETVRLEGAPSPDRAAPPCPYFARCGGCAWQHARYERQLAYKTQTVREQLAKVGGFDDPPLRDM